MSQLKDFVKKRGELYVPIKELELVLSKTPSVFVDVRRMILYYPQEFEHLPSRNGTLMRVGYILGNDDLADARYHVEAHLEDFFVGNGFTGSTLEIQRKNVYEMMDQADIPPAFKKEWFNHHDLMPPFELDYDLAGSIHYGQLLPLLHHGVFGLESRKNIGNKRRHVRRKA